MCPVAYCTLGFHTNLSLWTHKVNSTKQEQRSLSVPGEPHQAPQPCWRFVPQSHRGCPETARASAGSCCAYCPDTGPSGSENTHKHTCVPALWCRQRGSFQIACHLLHLQGLPASAQLQLDVLLSQVAGVLLRLQPLLQGVLITAEGQGDLREGRLGARRHLFPSEMFTFCHVLIPGAEENLYFTELYDLWMK